MHVLLKSRLLVALVFIAVARSALPAEAIPASVSTTVPGPPLSPEVAPDGRVTFRLLAPQAHVVTVDGEFLGDGESLSLARNADGVWAGQTSKPVAGTYRYTFVVDDVAMTDPRNVATSATQTTVTSLLHVDSPATALEDELPVPHGAVAQVYYPSATFGVERSLHVYTPPGYELGERSYPVLYLLHGRGDADGSWSTVGRAGFILDNLVAQRKALPMIVVMPAGHAPVAANTSPADVRAAQALFGSDLLNDIVPYIEQHYRISPRPLDHALAGLSMGGNQAATVGLAHSADFPYLGIFSAGLSAAGREQFDGRKAADLKLLWVGYGDTDFAKDNAVAMLGFFDSHDLKYVARETPGSHAWSTWRQHLEEFAPLLFR